MTPAVTPFAFQDHLVRVVMRGDEPWFVGKDVCAVLGLAKHDTALARLDDDEKAPHIMGTLGGPQTVIVISEPGLYRLIFTSRRPEAEAFTRWVTHDVLPQIRKTGAYRKPEPEPVTTAEPLRQVEVKLRLVQVAKDLYGLGYARKVFSEQGLTAITPALEARPDADARACLQHLLDMDEPATQRSIGDLLEAAFEDDFNAEALLRPLGVRAIMEGREEWVFVANEGDWLREAYQGTPWERDGWKRVLRRLPDAKGSEPMKVGSRPMRGTLLPARLLDKALLGAD